MAGINESLAFIPLRIAVLTVSDSRAAIEDTSGDLLVERIASAGHVLADRALVSDDCERIVACFRGWIAREDVDVVISTGGTGLTGRDVTPEALAMVAEKEIQGFAIAFQVLSLESVGLSAIQSRAAGAVAGGTYLFVLPGSPGACRDGWDGILRFQLDARYRPCNFVDIAPRLREHLGARGGVAGL